MTLFDEIEVACFDLFDTLIRIDISNLPEVQFGDSKIRSTIPILHDQIFASRGVSIEDLVAAMRTLWQEVRAELRMTEGSDDERYKELSAVDKYTRLLARLDAVGEDEVREVAEKVASVHHQCLVSSARPMDSAHELLGRVRARGIRTALVSNWDHARAGDAMLAQTGLAELLDHVVISEAVGIRKPHPRIFEHALAPSGVAPDRALHVGDLAEADAWGAGRLGFRTVWIDKSSEGWPSALGHPPTLQVAHLSELLDHV